MTEHDLINKMVTELHHNSRKYNDGCGGINYDFLSVEMASNLRLINRSEVEAPEWVFNCAIEAVDIYNRCKNK